MNKRKLWSLIAAPGLAVAGLLLAFLLLSWGAVGAAPGRASPIRSTLAQNNNFTVSGTVICEETGPISDVEVYVWDRDEGTGGSTGDFTDSSGAYSVTLEAGNYDLIFHPPCGSGCASKAHKGITGPDRTLDVVLLPGHSVSGTVFATDGVTPMGDVSIYAFNRDTADGFGLSLTKPNGQYCVGLVTGTYELGFTPPSCHGFGPTTTVILVTQDIIRDVTLPPGFTVGGCVTDGSSNPVSGVQVYAKDPDIGGFGFAPTNETGCYTGTLPLGTFDIQFIPPPRRGLGSITVVDVVSETGDCPNTRLDITLPAGFTVSGTVTCQVAPVKNVFVYAYPLEPPPSEDDDLGGWGLYTVDDGSYGLPLVPGTYSLEFIPPPATELNAKAFTTTQLITDTVLNVDFCVCSGVWVSETVDSAGDVGLSTSVALEPTYPYTPHISYRKIITRHDHNLKYACLSGTTWFSQTVDSGGDWTSLALVPTYPYTPCITHHDGASPNFWDWFLRYACRDGTAWTIMTVNSNQRAGQGGTSLALEPTYPFTPHISYYNPWATIATLHHAYLSDTIWMSGTWVHERVEPSGSQAGTWSSLALESAYPYTPHISYRDGATTTLDLKHAWLSNTTWPRETVDSAGDVGWYTSLALDSSGNPHISYYNYTNGDLKYARLSGATWLSETVDSIGAPPYGSGYSLALDQADAPHISYYDATNADLKFAHFNGTVWIIQTVDSEEDVGSWSSLALDQAGCPHISYYDATNGDLKYAYIPAYCLYMPVIFKNY